MNIQWLLSGIATSGVIGTAMLSAKAASDVASQKPKSPIKHYIPAAIMGLVTIGCILGGTTLGDVVQNNLTTALALGGQAAYERGKKLEEIYTVDGKPVKPTSYPSLQREQRLYFDMNRSIDDAYFGSTPEEILVALYHINRKMQIDGEVSYAEFYRWLRLPHQPYMENMGWSIGAGVVYGYEWIDLEREKIVLDDGLECTCINFVHKPTDDYMSYTPDEDDWDYDYRRNLWERF